MNYGKWISCQNLYDFSFCSSGPVGDNCSLLESLPLDDPKVSLITIFTSFSPSSHFQSISLTSYFLTFAFCCIVDCESHLHTSIVWNILIFLLSSCWTTLLSVLDKNLVSALANLTSLEIYAGKILLMCYNCQIHE